MKEEFAYKAVRQIFSIFDLNLNEYDQEMPHKLQTSIRHREEKTHNMNT